MNKILLPLLSSLGLMATQSHAIESITIQNPPELRSPKLLNSIPFPLLTVEYKQGEIYNPNTQKMDKVNLRQYIGAVSSGSNFIAPVLRTRPGESLQLTLKNNLPPEDSSCPDHINDHNVPHCFNSTNLHTHGLWINPGNNEQDKNIASDNIFINLKPQNSQQYQFDLPKDHPAGTYWYHTHLHGSTALQVTSGMAGALIVEGNRKPVFDLKQNLLEPGDIDLLWKAAYPTKDLYSEHDRIFVFQQIQYACKNADKTTYDCQENQVGEVNDYDLLGPTDWKTSHRYTAINGHVLDKIDAKQNEYYRWRMIHGGIRDTIALEIRQLNVAIPQFKSALEEKIFVQKACENPANLAHNALNYQLIAQDGLTMNQLQEKAITVFQPGYRYDAAMMFPNSGVYCVLDKELSATQSINSGYANDVLTSQPYQLLAWVNVDKNTATTPKATPFSQFLSAQVSKLDLNSVEKKYIENQLLNANLSVFSPHKSLENYTGPMGKQELTFTIKIDEKQNFKFAVSDKMNDPDGAKSFDAEATPRTLLLNQVDEWTLTSKAKNLTNDAQPGHPFHIHVNPFQIQHIYKIKDGTRIDVSGKPTSVKEIDLEFNNLKGVWKDTIFVPANYEIVVRSKYQKFTGDFVLHCHILDHEDNGMMQSIRICAEKNNCQNNLKTSHSH